MEHQVNIKKLENIQAILWYMAKRYNDSGYTELANNFKVISSYLQDNIDSIKIYQLDNNVLKD